jgi:hypothetical protein
MKENSFIRRVLRRVRRTIPWRRQLKQKLRWMFGIEPRRDHLRAFAEFAGVFDAAWYVTTYRDVAASGVDPFTHYMENGWRDRRKPADGIDIESVAAMIPGFQAGQDNPMSWVLKSASHLNAVRVKKSERVPIPLPRNLDDGLCVTGYLRSEIGLGQAARNVVYACDAVRLPVSSRALTLLGRDNNVEFASKCNLAVDRKAQVVVTDLPAMNHHRLEVAPGRLNVLFPFWELGRIPKEWHAGIRDFDEVWAPSRFVASAFADISGVTLHYVPQPVRLPPQPPARRLDRSTLRFFTFLDFDSYVARKNPQAAINTFRAAFPSAKRDVELVVKTHGMRDEGLRKWLGEAAMRDDRIRIVDRTLDRVGMDAMMMECDAFITLHRSEGFGLGAAEALAAGKAVVATDYGGTTDFINELTGYPVAYALERVRDGEYVHTQGQVWANPNADAAVDALRAIHASPGEAEARARRGFALLKDQQSLPVVGRCIARILGDHGVINAGG